MYKGYTAMVNGVKSKWLTAECKFIEMIKPIITRICALLNYFGIKLDIHKK